MYRATDGYIFLFLVAAIHGLPTNIPDVDTGNSSNTRIVGGSIVTDRREFPYQDQPLLNIKASSRPMSVIMWTNTAKCHSSVQNKPKCSFLTLPSLFKNWNCEVSIRWSHGHVCGGSVIDAEHVLTAAHCVVDNNNKVMKPSEVTVRVGDLYIYSTSITTVTKSVKYIFVHEKYNSNDLPYDIAVLRVSSPFNFTAYTDKIDLTSTRPATNVTCKVSGWGATVNDGSASLVLQFVVVPIFPQADCNAAYTGLITNSMICAGYREGGKDACQGDSGGPLVCNNTLAGIVSWGRKCAETNYPGVYTDVSSYLKWIKAQLTRASSNTAFLNLYLASICTFVYLKLI